MKPYFNNINWVKSDNATIISGFENQKAGIEYWNTPRVYILCGERNGNMYNIAFDPVQKDILAYYKSNI